MEKKEIFAKMVRTVFVPPVMVTALILVLLAARKGVISSGAETAAAILFLGIVPVLAYPAQRFMPCYKDAGREGQRKLACLFSLAGYALALASGIFFKGGAGDDAGLFDLFYFGFASDVLQHSSKNKGKRAYVQYNRAYGAARLVF